MESSVEKTQNVAGKLLVSAILAYLLVHYNYEISQYLMSRWDVWWAARGEFFSDMERAGDDAGILGSLILLILWMILGLVSLLLFLVIGGAVWIAGKLNEVYVLPFIVALLIVKSRFSYVVFIRPLNSAVLRILSILKWFGKTCYRAFFMFVVIPVAEVYSAKHSTLYRAYRVSTSVLFLVGAASLILGVGGVAAHYAKQVRLLQRTESAVTEGTAVIGAGNYQQEQFQVTVQGSHPHWTITNIVLERDDRLSMTATGEATLLYPRNSEGKFQHITTAPEGMRNLVGSGEFMLPSRFTNDFRRRGYRPGNFILPDEPLYGLIGKIGTGPAFYIGSSLERRADVDGALMLGINQLWRTKEDWQENSGAYQVTIIVSRR